MQNEGKKKELCYMELVKMWKYQMDRSCSG